MLLSLIQLRNKLTDFINNNIITQVLQMVFFFKFNACLLSMPCKKNYTGEKNVVSIDIDL